MKLQRLDLAILVIFIGMTICCIAVFLLPTDVQVTLKANTTNPNPLAWFTSTFVHENNSHLISNLVVLLISGMSLFALNKNSKRFLFISVLLVIFGLPFIFGAIFQLVCSFYGWILVYDGLSTVVSGLLGLIVFSFISYFKEELQTPKYNWICFLSILLLTFSTISFAYIVDLYSFSLFLTTFIAGFALLFLTFRKVFFMTKIDLKQEKKKIAIGLGVLFVYVILIAMAFPSNILQSTGIVNILAHYAGLLFGMFVSLIALLVRGR